ncbi:MAG: ECF-type sigma factor [Phycisphaerales bacterium]|jgi:RNA polymerase sigma-70 factor (ECF subfamily)
MDPGDATGITKLLQDAGKGDEAARDELAPLVLAELRQIAERAMAKERRGHTLQPTVLADEAFMRLVGSANIDWEGRSQFYGYAARAIRQILVDHARQRNAAKRGGGHGRVDIETMGALGESEGEQHLDVLTLHEALQELEKLDARQSRIMELKFFGQRSIEEIAQFVGVSPRTVNNDVKMALAWLRMRLGTA